jgi:hypothetical protein
VKISYADGPSFAMRVSGSIFSPPATLKTQSSQRKDIFFLLLFSFLSKENKKEVNLAFFAVNSKGSKLGVLCGKQYSFKDPFRVTVQATLFRGGN